MDILPAIDLRDGRCVRLLQGNYERQINYSDDPIAQAQQFAAAGAKWLHVVDLDGAREGRLRNLDVIGNIIKATSMNVEVGGGIRDDATIDSLFDAGAARVVVGTRALEDWEWFRAVVHKDGHEKRIALGLDSREGKLAVRGWTQVTERRAIDAAEAAADWPLGAIIYTDIARDGMLLGPNMEAIRSLAEFSVVPVVASGGVTDIEDVRRLVALPISGIIIGRAIYERQIDLAEAIRIAAGAGR
jgi:phosphoribosylformimino-5-aminoimidazole carboxamide ribotide isomerase